MSNNERKPVLITFKPKEQRPDKGKDKLAVISDVVATDVRFFNAEDMSRKQGVPSGIPEELIGYDVNEYEAPIVMAQLSEKEVDSLRKNNNVAVVEDDGPCYALNNISLREDLVVEGQPSPQAETIPAGVSQLKAPAAWDCTKGKAVKVFILDTGIDYNHPDLKPNYKGGISFVTGESSPMDFQSHGTHCAGTVAAAINGAGVVGVAPKAYLYAVKVLSKTGSGNWSWLIAGIDWVTKKKGLKVLSMSLGGSSAPQALETMCNTAWKKGCLLVAAAGNAGPGPNTVGFPAKYENVIAVSAIDTNNFIAGFSSRGPEVELCAPGVKVLSTIPGGGHGTKSGTSMACPHVSGSAALAWGAHRYTDNVTIRRLLAWTSDNLGIPGRDDLYGYGRVDPENAACADIKPPAIPGIP